MLNPFFNDFIYQSDEKIDHSLDFLMFENSCHIQ